MTINGAILIGRRERSRPGSIRAVDPATGLAFGPAVSESDSADVADACGLAAAASEQMAATSPEVRAQFLETIAEQVLEIGDLLIETAMAETGLPRARLEGERGRTVGQLRMFAAEVRQGRWIDATIDPSLPERVPPRADLRRMNLAIGPVAVFGASNFPLAFSVAGGDTAAAFAAGCPVVVKGHPAHPGTGELVARAIRSAVVGCDLPEGAFSFLPGSSHALGAALTADPRIKSVAFTGSRRAGLALVEIAAKRSEPIPVYAEMSSINPVVLLPAALATRAEELGAAFAASLTLSAGQFCTNPGLVVAIANPDLDRFIAAAGKALAGGQPATMLTSGIAQAYRSGVSALAERAAPIVWDEAPAPSHRCTSALFAVSAADFLQDPALGDEVFGPSSVVVSCRSVEEIALVLSGLEGQLTATLHLEAADEAQAALLLPILRRKVGRVLANGWPTGVEVTPAMVHGGPFPATSDSRTTSVGTLAMTRFLRPVCFQDIPDSLLPPALKAENPWRIPRRIDGEWRSA